MMISFSRPACKPEEPVGMRIGLRQQCGGKRGWVHVVGQPVEYTSQAGMGMENTEEDATAWEGASSSMPLGKRSGP